MNLSTEQRKRLAEMAKEMAEIFGEADDCGGRPRTFSELEDECIAVGDWLTAAMLQDRVAAKVGATDGESPPCCPSCDQPGEATPAEPRVLQTDRGDVEWNESAYYCRRCRRAFFPSVG